MKKEDVTPAVPCKGGSGPSHSEALRVGQGWSGGEWQMRLWHPDAPVEPRGQERVEFRLPPVRRRLQDHAAPDVLLPGRERPWGRVRRRGTARAREPVVVEVPRGTREALLDPRALPGVAGVCPLRPGARP